MSLPARTTKIEISISCSLKYETGTLDYHQTFNLTSFLDTINVDNRHPPRSNQRLYMNILSQNVQGDAGADFWRVFRDLTTTHRPDVIILTETRVSGHRASTIITTLGFDRYIKVDAMSFAGCICVLWNPQSVYIEPVGSSFQEIHLQVRVSNKLFLLTVIYASPDYSKRKLLWSSLSELGPMLNIPWLIMGDFNDISNPAENFGGGLPNQTKITNYLNSCNLLDLGCIGPCFTQTNNRPNGQTIRTRINRCHATLLAKPIS